MQDPGSREKLNSGPEGVPFMLSSKGVIPVLRVQKLAASDALRTLKAAF